MSSYFHAWPNDLNGYLKLYVNAHIAPRTTLGKKQELNVPGFHCLDWNGNYVCITDKEQFLVIVSAYSNTICLEIQTKFKDVCLVDNYLHAWSEYGYVYIITADYKINKPNWSYTSSIGTQPYSELFCSGKCLFFGREHSSMIECHEKIIHVKPIADDFLIHTRDGFLYRISRNNKILWIIKDTVLHSYCCDMNNFIYAFCRAYITKYSTETGAILHTYEVSLHHDESFKHFNLFINNDGNFVLRQENSNLITIFKTL